MTIPTARFTSAELRRALRAAAAAGEEWAVRIERDGSIEVYRRPVASRDKALAFSGEVKL